MTPDPGRHRCASPTCPGRSYKASDIAHPPNCGVPPGWILIDDSGPVVVLGSEDCHWRITIDDKGNLAAFENGAMSFVPHVAAVFLLGLHSQRQDFESKAELALLKMNICQLRSVLEVVATTGDAEHARNLAIAALKAYCGDAGNGGGNA